MSEIYKKIINEQQKSQGENEQYDQWRKDHPEIVMAPEDLRECEPEIAELEEMFTEFESEHSLEELLLIANLTPQEAPKHPIREPARKALILIVAKLKMLGKETNISSEKHGELRAKYMQLSRAVGIINNNKIDHNR